MADAIEIIELLQKLNLERDPAKLAQISNALSEEYVDQASAYFADEQSMSDRERTIYWTSVELLQRISVLCDQKAEEQRRLFDGMWELRDVK